jgi:hypothetical protein
MMPSLFIAHGAPLLAIENNEYTQFVNQLGKEFPKDMGMFWVTEQGGTSYIAFFFQLLFRYSS